MVHWRDFTPSSFDL
uniref:Uncharacterized protein n=1 Tax=Rhizophora mucronata TaxID=61149 RepID=A0A2P2L7U0_RHIMU